MDTDLKAPPAQASEDTAKRRQIMDGARRVFLSGGFDGASMNDVARAAGVSKGTLYVYFDSKEQLFETLIREDRKQQAERLVIPGDPSNPRKLLGEFGRRLIGLMTQPDLLAHLRVVIAVAGKFPNLGRAFYEAGPCHGERKLAVQLEKSREAGALDFEDSDRAARQFIDLCKSGIFTAALFGVTDNVTDKRINENVDSAVELFMRVYGGKELPRKSEAVSAHPT